MKLLLASLFVVFATRLCSCNLRGLDTFEFGPNVGRVSFTASGSIRVDESVKNVTIVDHNRSEIGARSGIGAGHGAGSGAGEGAGLGSGKPDLHRYFVKKTR